MASFIFAAVPETKARDGPRAIASATRACELTVERGDFDRAVNRQEQALALSPKDDVPRPASLARLALYKDKKRYRECSGPATVSARCSGGRFPYSPA